MNVGTGDRSAEWPGQRLALAATFPHGLGLPGFQVPLLTWLQRPLPRMRSLQLQAQAETPLKGPSGHPEMAQVRPPAYVQEGRESLYPP